jgi:hypothetical protein
MNQFNIIFYGFYTALFFTPIFSLALKNRFRKPSKTVLLTSSVLLFFSIAFHFFGISLVGTIPNVIALYVLYLIVGFSSFHVFFSAQRKIIKVVGGIISIPFILLPAISVSLVLVVMFIAGDMEQKYEIKNENGVICRVSEYGNATTSTNGYDIKLFKSAIIFEKLLAYKQIENTYKPEITAESACKMALSEIKS